MKTTRRAAIIAALLAPFTGLRGASGPAQLSGENKLSVGFADDQVPWLQLEIPEYQPLGYPTVVGTSDDGYTAIMEYPPREAYDCAIEIRYKDRVVRLTGDEIMDALEVVQ